MAEKFVRNSDYSEEGNSSNSADYEDSFDEERELGDKPRDLSESDVDDDSQGDEQGYGVIATSVSRNEIRDNIDILEQEELGRNYIGENGEEEDSGLTPRKDDARSSAQAQTSPLSRQRGISWTQKMTRKSRISKQVRSTSDGRTILPDQPLKGPDTLTWRTRIHYESTKSKMVVSFILGAFSMALFGLCAISGGKGEALYWTSLAYGDVDASLWFNSTSGNYTTVYSTEVIELAFDGQEYKDLDESLLYTFAQAFGFACFCYLVAVVLSIMAAVRISPLLCGAGGEYAAIMKFKYWEENMYFLGIPTPTFTSFDIAKKNEDYLKLQPYNNKRGTSDQADCDVEEGIGGGESPCTSEQDKK